REFAVDHDGRDRLDAERLGASCNIDVLHIVNRYFAGRTGRALHHFNDFGAGSAARTEHLDFSLCGLALLLHWMLVRSEKSPVNGVFRSPILHALDISARPQLAHFRGAWQTCRSTD